MLCRPKPLFHHKVRNLHLESMTIWRCRPGSASHGLAQCFMCKFKKISHIKAPYLKEKLCSCIQVNTMWYIAYVHIHTHTHTYCITSHTYVHTWHTYFTHTIYQELCQKYRVTHLNNLVHSSCRDGIIIIHVVPSLPIRQMLLKSWRMRLN